MGNYYFKPQNTWIDKLNELTRERAAYKRDVSLMTPYEEAMARRAFDEHKERDYSYIFAGARVMLLEAIGKYKSAQDSVVTAKKYELARWDSGKLADEMRLTEQLVSVALKVGNNAYGGDTLTGRLEGIFKDAMASEDIHKQRGACEVLKAALAGVSASGAGEDVRLAANRLAREAESALEELRETPGMIKASQEMSEATDSLLVAHEQVCQIGEFLDGQRADNPLGGSSFGQLARRVGFKNNRITVYDEQAPEVTGVYWPAEVKAVSE